MTIRVMLHRGELMAFDTPANCPYVIGAALDAYGRTPYCKYRLDKKMNDGLCSFEIDCPIADKVYSEKEIEELISNKIRIRAMLKGWSD